VSTLLACQFLLSTMCWSFGSPVGHAQGPSGLSFGIKRNRQFALFDQSEKWFRKYEDEEATNHEHPASTEMRVPDLER
jgi:hypothetical protein